MIAVDIYIKFVALFPRFLNQPCADIVLAHVVDQVFKLREIWWFINEDIAIWVPWVTPEALGMLSIDGGNIVFLFVIIFCCSQIHGAVGLCGVHRCWAGSWYSHESCPWAWMERRMG